MWDDFRGALLTVRRRFWGRRGVISHNRWCLEQAKEYLRSVIAAEDACRKAG